VAIDYLGEACIMAMSLDVTELRATEQARQAQAQAEEASRAKTEFLSRMSHELRTPLNAVLGFSQLLLADSRLSVEQAAQLGHVRHAGRHLLALINDVLDISRIETGHLPVASEAVKLGAPIDEAVRMLLPLAQAHTVTLAQVLPQEVEPACVRADPVRLRQVLINLLSNAVKYNRPGGWVRIEVQPTGERWMVRVADNGIGMTDAQLAKLYEPFNRLGRERGPVEGSGIGMALTRQLVWLMGGELAVRSVVEQGTVVELTLPAAEASEAAERPASVEAPGAAALPAGEPAGVLLYVEDNPVNLLLVEQMLSRWPAVRMVKADDGRTGLDLARTLRPHVVLLDMHLPDLDGPEVLRRLRADPATSSLVVVALSASAMADEVSAARAAGANDYWTKPFDVDQMLGDLRRLLPSRDAHEARSSMQVRLD
jgi:CheY-like chemotaxis protein/nitrogen-specific signal transduction histidine kinase